MIDIKELKKVDPKLAMLSDEKALEIRDLLYRMAELALNNYYQSKSVSKYPSGDNTTCERL